MQDAIDSDVISSYNLGIIVVTRGIEPLFQEPKSCVLPLDEVTITISF